MKHFLIFLSLACNKQVAIVSSPAIIPIQINYNFYHVSCLNDTILFISTFYVNADSIIGNGFGAGKDHVYVFEAHQKNDSVIIQQYHSIDKEPKYKGFLKFVFKNNKIRKVTEKCKP